MYTSASVSPDAFLKQLYDERETARKRILGTWQEKADRIKRELIESLGDFGLNAPTNDRQVRLGHETRVNGVSEVDASGEPLLDPILLERVELDEVIRERVEFTTVGGLRMQAFVVIPMSFTAGGKRPAVLLWHGHGNGSRSLVGLQADGTPVTTTGKPADNLALEFARRGMVAMAPEIVGFGDRRLERDLRSNPNINNSCFNLSVSLLMSGKTTAGLRTCEAIRAMDYLASRPEVDAQRVGNMGHSGGGMVASLSAALDTRIKASVVGIYPNTFQGSILAMQHCLCNYIPRILDHAEMPDLLGLIAPRYLFIEAGLDDPIFPIATTRVCLAQLEAIYRQMGFEGRLESHLFEGSHEISGERSIDWLAQILSRSVL